MSDRGWAKFCLFLTLVCCGQVNEPEVLSASMTMLSPIVVEQGTLENYKESTFSANVLLSDSGKDILLNYNFFPIGTDFCSQPSFDAQKNPNGCKDAPMISIPCEYLTVHADDWMLIDTARTVENSCQNNTYISVDGSKFTLSGMLVEASQEVLYFVNEFEFKIAVDGFYDATDGSRLQIAEGSDTLEGVYTSLIAKRLSGLEQN